MIQPSTGSSMISLYDVTKLENIFCVRKLLTRTIEQFIRSARDDLCPYLRISTSKLKNFSTGIEKVIFWM